MNQNKLDHENEGRFENQNLIVCEGKADAAFFRHILDVNRISGFQVGFPNAITAEGQFGHAGFGTYLKASKARPGYDRLKNIIISRDSDVEPSKSLYEVCGQIHEAGSYTVPDEPRKACGKNPSMSVLLIPGNESGNLETLLLKAVLPEHKEHLESCFSHMGCDDLPVTISSKKKMTTIIAAKNNKNPSCSLAYIWSREQAEYNPISMLSPAISDIVNFLRSFSD